MAGPLFTVIGMLNKIMCRCQNTRQCYSNSSSLRTVGIINVNVEKVKITVLDFFIRIGILLCTRISIIIDILINDNIIKI